jgi:formate hydrogenlyase subunit 6/NADH:ubiquinone oxidoreductase subunit I
MRFGTMLKDIGTSLLKRPVTEHYPVEKSPAPARLRGRLYWDAEKCIGCELCAKDCPAMAIEFFVLDKKAKRFVFGYHIDRCTFCAQCVQSCRQECLEMSAVEWELASLSRDAFTVYYGEAEDVREALAGTASANGSSPAAE